ncbi:MAG: CHASE2 domain-containing protein [Acidobacteriota bacterium]|nr:CHASE2 domain-containing protein [Acidobacteriota bacterium]
MKRKWKHWVIYASIALTSAIGAWMLSGVGFFEQLNLKTSDTQFILRGLIDKKFPSLARQPNTDIMLVVIDSKTLEAFPEPMIFWNPHFADAIQAAASGGAKVIAIDHAFAIPVSEYKPDHDRILSEAVMNPGVAVVLNYVPEAATQHQENAVPANMLAASLGFAALPNLTADQDDFIRNQELLAASDSTVTHMFALRTAEKFLSQDAVMKDNRLSLAGHTIPISPERAITIHYTGGPDTFPRVSLSDFIGAFKAGRKDQLEGWVKGRAVLVGDDDIADRHATPFYTFSPGANKWLTAGVEIHANTLRTLLDRDYLLPAPNWARLLALLLVTGAGVMIAGVGAARHAGLWIALEIALVLAGTQAVFRAGWILYAAELLVGLALCVLGSVVYRFFTAEKRGNLFRQAVSVFVGKKVASTLDESEAIAHTGTRQTLTILFTDIRGFTAFCESKDPAEIVELLNHYLATMVSIIVKYQGHVNKFIGDGILAIFSDEECVVAGDHALRAVRCATEIVSTANNFKTGAGIHTGPAVVGNIGSPDKMEYTVLGDTVNLASRLESLNKEHHTRLLMSGDTQAMLGDAVGVVCLGSVPVRGKSEPIPLYTVAALADVAERPVVTSVLS